MSVQQKILIADDEEFNLELLIELLTDEGYTTIGAHDGQEAWDLLESSPELFHAVLLDRMMPRLDGLSVLHRMKNHPTLAQVPVIFQTAKASMEDILEGMEAGSYYYITKPFKQIELLGIVRAAVSDFGHMSLIAKNVKDLSRQLSSMRYLTQAEFRFRTLQEAFDLAPLLASSCQNPERVTLGLSELLINAVEHGNLGITYQDKTRLNQNGEWTAEVNRRSSLPENCTKYVSVRVDITYDSVCFTIVDEGPGFDWESYLSFRPERAFDNHGRGIATSRMVSFDELKYVGTGNKVIAIHKTCNSKKCL